MAIPPETLEIPKQLRRDSEAQTDEDLVFGLSMSQISRRVDSMARAAGLGDGYSSHSGRVGLAIRMTRRGAPLQALQTHGRWKSPQMRHGTPGVRRRLRLWSGCERVNGAMHDCVHIAGMARSRIVPEHVHGVHHSTNALPQSWQVARWPSIAMSLCRHAPHRTHRRPELSGTSCLQGTAFSPSSPAAEQVPNCTATETTAATRGADAAFFAHCASPANCYCYRSETYVKASQLKVRNSVPVGPPNWTKSRTVNLGSP